MTFKAFRCWKKKPGLMNRSKRHEYNGQVLIKYSPELRTVTTGKEFAQNTLFSTNIINTYIHVHFNNFYNPNNEHRGKTKDTTPSPDGREASVRSPRASLLKQVITLPPRRSRQARQPLLLLGDLTWP